MGDLSGILPGLFYIGNGAEREDRGSGSIDGACAASCFYLSLTRAVCRGCRCDLSTAENEPALDMHCGVAYTAGRPPSSYSALSHPLTMGNSQTN
jgi:hypothetical protein